jgi:hypothetical protein
LIFACVNACFAFSSKRRMSIICRNSLIFCLGSNSGSREEPLVFDFLSDSAAGISTGNYARASELDQVGLHENWRKMRPGAGANGKVASDSASTHPLFKILMKASGSRVVFLVHRGASGS